MAVVLFVDRRSALWHSVQDSKGVLLLSPRNRNPPAAVAKSPVRVHYLTPAAERRKNEGKEIFGFARASRAYDLVLSHHALRACHISQDFAGSKSELFGIMTTSLKILQCNKKTPPSAR